MDYKHEFHHRPAVLLALAVGGLIGLARELIAGIGKLYAFAQTPQGLPAVVVGTGLVCVAILVVVLMRR